MRIGAFLWFSFFFSSVVFAQKNTQKALLAIQENNFGLAHGYLQKELLKAPIAASYGLSVYYLTPFCYQADSAFAYLTFLERAYPALDAKSKTKLQTDLALQDTTVQHLFGQLATQELQKTTAAPQIEVLEQYMLRYGQRFPTYKAVAVRFRDSLAFEQALHLQSANAMLVFSVMYPQAVQQKDARARYELLLYQERTQHDTEAELVDFLTDFPQNPFAEEAMSRIYNKYSQVETLQSFTHFIQTFPAAPQVASAWKQIYRLYMQPYSVEKLAQFKVAYPAYPFLEDLASDGDLLLKKLYPFVQNGAYGYMDTQGKGIIEAQYDDASAFYDGLAIVSKNELFGLINKKNESITALKYLDISRSTEGFIAEDSAGFYIFNNQGQLLQKDALQSEELQQTLSALSNYIETVEPTVVSKYERIERNGKIGLNKNGKVVLAPKYDDIIVQTNATVFVVKQGKNLLYFDTTGKRQEINGLEWFLTAPELAFFTKEGFAVYAKSGKLGLMDAKGKVVIKNTYDAAQPFWAGLWPVQLNGKWSLVSLDAKILLPFVNQKITPFIPFGFLVEQENKLGLIDTTGKWLLNTDYKTIKRLESNYFLVENDNGLGLFSTDGTPIIACAYQRIVRFDQTAFQLSTPEGLAYYLIADQKILISKP